MPKLPVRAQTRPYPTADSFQARAAGAPGEVWFAFEWGGLAHQTATGGIEYVTLPSTPEIGGNAQTITAMFALSPTEVYACGDIGRTYRYDGTQWSVSSDNWCQSGNIGGLWASSSADVWATAGSHLRRRLNGTWTSYAVGDTVLSIDGTGPNDVWFGGWQGYLAHWDGTQYQVVLPTIDDGDIRSHYDIEVLGPGDVAFENKRIINNQVFTSAQLGYPAVPQTTFGTTNDFWIAGRATGQNVPRAIWHYKNGTWTEHPGQVVRDRVEIVGTGPDDVWFLFDTGVAHWDGTTYSSCAQWGGLPPGDGRLDGVGSYDDLWLQPAARGDLWRSRNGGAFVQMTEDAYRSFDAHASGVFAVSGIDEPVLGGARPTVSRFDGRSWSAIVCPWMAGEHAILHTTKVVANNDVWFAGTNGHVYRWNGSTCSTVRHPPAATTLRHIEATGPNDVWLFGTARRCTGTDGRSCDTPRRSRRSRR